MMSVTCSLMANHVIWFLPANTLPMSMDGSETPRHPIRPLRAISERILSQSDCACSCVINLSLIQIYIITNNRLFVGFLLTFLNDTVPTCFRAMASFMMADVCLGVRPMFSRIADSSQQVKTCWEYSALIVSNSVAI